MGQNDGEASGAEARRLQEARERHVPWRKWGPYLSERQWGTVREDYSDDGDAWNYFSHDQARWRAYCYCWIAAAMNRPGEDSMWDEEDGFYYDLLRLPDGRAGLGASHQAGWTGLVGTLIQLFGRQDPQRALEVGKMAAFARGEAKE